MAANDKAARPGAEDAARGGGLPKLHDRQAPASDPERNVWLSASAGTGKTQVLAARVFRLLLRGVAPDAIQCLTFTKAGAAEMAARITGRLARWVRMPEEALRKDLYALGEDHLDPAVQARARTLFARVLDAPGGGLRIQTIHSYCQGLLSAFPVEAGLIPGFRPLEAREEAVLARDALAEMLVDAEREGQGALIDAVGALSLRLGEGQAEVFLRACARAGAAMEALPSGVAPFVRRALDLPSGDIEEVLAAACTDAAFDCASLRRVADVNHAWGTATGAKYVEAIGRWLAADPAARAAMLAELNAVFRTGKGEPRKATKKQVELDPSYPDLVEELGDACSQLLQLAERAAYADILSAGLMAGRAYARAYARAKHRIGAVDFDDLIRATVALLGQPGMGEWVRFKLDQTTEHLLIDEAQDTNADQWAIVAAIADEFFAGTGTHEAGARTLFVVGDYKQAIFGFQGTDPIYFRAAHERFRRLAAGQPEYDVEAPGLDTLSLTESFRSTPPILEFVDAALEALPEPKMGAFGTAERHSSFGGGAGRVTLWPVTAAGGSEEEEEEWIGEPVRKLATDLARAIRDWLHPETGMVLESKGRRLRPQDVMVLVKRRGELASLLVARLYAEGVPVAGVDRLRLNAPLAVQDLLAAIRFVSQTEDDLSLAALLVSPLIGWSQEELMEAAARGRGSLWRHLRATQPAERLAPLHAMLARADIATPYRFLEEILSGAMDGRRKLLLRLGEEARDPIEELLNAALSFETTTTPSLQRFLDWFDRGDVEIKRDAEAELNAVRVMTAHGAKGLQAPLVILADAASDPRDTRRDMLDWSPEELDGLSVPIFRPRAGERGGPLAELVADAERRDMEEHWRLFYVAATRAEERLVIAGALGARAGGEPPESSWYAAASAAFDRLGVAAAEGENAERVFHGLSPARARPLHETTGGEDAAAGGMALPEWARRPAPREAQPPRPLAPSALGEDLVSDPPPGPHMRAAAERGRLLHALFERLPPVAPDARRAAADRWLARAGGVDDPAARAALADAVLTVIEDARFAELFGPQSLAEAPVAAVLDNGMVVSGTVDRLVVRDGVVRVIDFKTGRRAPASIGEIPPYHLRQMAAYVGALQVVFPEHAVEAALLYVAGPVLHVLDDAVIAAQKQELDRVQQSLTDKG